MKRKYYIRGIGVGILFATIVLFTAYSVFGGKKMTDEEIMDRAEELGMVYSESALENLTKPADTQEANDSEANSTNDSTDTSASDTSDSDTESTDTTAEEPTTEEPTTEATTEVTTEAASSTSGEEGRMVTFTVVSGMSSWNVATILRDQGVIEDASDFDAYLVANGYSSKINIGEYSVAVGTDYESIAKMLTTR
ncbi:MAG: hypothetical protein IJ040_02700 [Lachnospiraceae bacterium]|nr:hypothetical protein [Lachnospiraceae bacterium]